MSKDREKSNICGAKTRKGSPCQKPPIAGKKRCRLHGGLSPGAKKGNTYAVKHGIYRNIVFNQLTKDQQDFYEHYDVKVLDEIDNDIKMIDIRVSYLMGNIKELRTHGQLVSEKNVLYSDGGGMTETKYDHVEPIINQIEAEITRLGKNKTKLLELKHKIESGSSDIQVDVKPYLDALKGNVKDVWDDEEEDEDESTD